MYGKLRKSTEIMSIHYKCISYAEIEKLPILVSALCYANVCTVCAWNMPYYSALQFWHMGVQLCDMDRKCKSYH